MRTVASTSLTGVVRTGKTIVQDVTPAPIVIAPLLDAGVKPGVYAQFVEAGGRAKNGNSFGVVVLTQKSADVKTIGSFFGFDL
jgi:hypothetical protein